MALAMNDPVRLDNVKTTIDKIHDMLLSDVNVMINYLSGDLILNKDYHPKEPSYDIDLASQNADFLSICYKPTNKKYKFILHYYFIGKNFDRTTTEIVNRLYEKIDFESISQYKTASYKTQTLEEMVEFVIYCLVPLGIHYEEE